MATFLRELLATWRAAFTDAGTVLLLVIAPVIYGFFYPWPYSTEVAQRVPVAVVDLDHSALSRQITRFAQASPRLAVQTLASEAEAKQAFWEGRIVGYAVLPRDLKRDVLRGRQAVVPVAANGSYLLLNKTVLYGFAEAVGTVSAGIELRQLGARGVAPDVANALRDPVPLQAVAQFNPAEGYGSSLVPAVAMLILQQTLLMAAGMLIGTWAEQEAESEPEPVLRQQLQNSGALRVTDGPESDHAPASHEGSMPAAAPPLLRTTAAGWTARVVALAVPNALLGAFYFGWLFQWQGYGHGGNVPASVLLIALFSLSCAALGCLLGLALRNRERAMQLLLFGALPLFFLSGHPWPVSALPEALQLLRWLSPSTPAIEASIRLNQMGASLADVAPQMLALAVLGATGFAALIRLGSKRR